MPLSQEQYPSTTTDASVIRLILSDQIQSFLLPAVNSLPFDTREILEIVTYHAKVQIENTDAILVDILDDEDQAYTTKLYELTEDQHEFYNDIVCGYDLISDLHEVIMNAYDLTCEEMDDLLDGMLELNAASEDVANTMRDFIIDLKRVHGYDYDTLTPHLIMDIEYGLYCAYFVINGLRMRAA